MFTHSPLVADVAALIGYSIYIFYILFTKTYIYIYITVTRNTCNICNKLNLCTYILRTLKRDRRRAPVYHNLDIYPIPEEVLYINELSLAENVPYETKDTMEKAVTGKCVRDSGILPDDNVRIYVPMDLNADIIMVPKK